MYALEIESLKVPQSAGALILTHQYQPIEPWLESYL